MLKQNYIENIDFIKGLAAISVILLHTLPLNILYNSFAVYHIWQAVPIFLLITFFLGFRGLEKKDDIFKGYYSVVRIKTVFSKLLFPLIIFAILEAFFFKIIGNNNKAVGSLLFYDNGPGSYYIWIYLQIWLLLPLVYSLLKKSKILGGGNFADN